jgi:hypothetical protein
MQHWHGIRQRTFQAFGLLGNANSTATKSRLSGNYGDDRNEVVRTVQL